MADATAVSGTSEHPVVVVGGGLSGIACARRLQAAGVPVTVVDRGRRLGGRLAVRTETLDAGAHPVDIGAPYFTVRDEAFAHVVTQWQEAGLARPWTDTLAVVGPAGRGDDALGPMRWSSTRGLRALVEHLAEGLDVRLAHEVSAVTPGADGGWQVDVSARPGALLRPHDTGQVPAGQVPAAQVPAGQAVLAPRAVVLAMPDPQAERLLPPEVARTLGVSDRAWSPVIAVWASWPRRWWPPLDGAFVDSEVITWIADSGSSRGDGAPVLVAHTTAAFAAPRLADPASAIAPVLAEVARVLGGPTPDAAVPEPTFSRAHRWSLASAVATHDESFGLIATGASPSDGLIGVCSDAWGPRSRVEQAWCSGDAMGAALAERLALSFSGPQV